MAGCWMEVRVRIFYGKFSGLIATLVIIAKKKAAGNPKISLPPFAKILLLEIFKCRVIGAGEFHDVPSWFQLEIEFSLPGFY
jgi:hypothetical protein